MQRLRIRRLSVLLALLAGAALRLYFIHADAQVQGDSLMYGDIAKNWLIHGIYGFAGTTDSGRAAIFPTLIRLPGYPAFLAVCFALFGIENYRSVFYVQAAIDLGSCLLIAAFVRKISSRRAALVALWLAALCPFTSNYVAIPLAETLSIFCVAGAFYVFARLLEKPSLPPSPSKILALAALWSYAALLRPDGALLAVTLFLGILAYGRSNLGFATAVRTAFLCALLSVLPFVAWTVRNWHVFHVFQPLAPRLATDPNEVAPAGFDRWTKTWLIDFASTADIYWSVPGGQLNIHDLPARAFDSPGQYQRTERLFAKYNVQDVVTPGVDGGFSQLASERQSARPFRSYIVLPWLRLMDMWLRPRVEMLNVELRWWQYSKHRAETEFAAAYGLLNLVYLIAAAAGALAWPRFRGVMLGYLVLRSALLLTVAAPETRYTLECFPILFAFAGQGLERFSYRCMQVPAVEHRNRESGLKARDRQKTIR